MNIEILNLTKKDRSEDAIEIALPVLALECEATPPISNYLDAYEETVLKLVSIGMSVRGISKTLNASESLVEEILEHLNHKHYIQKDSGKPWELSDDGIKYLNDGSVEDRESDKSEYGYVFVNAIKKDVLPFFYVGDINQAPLYQGVIEKVKKITLLESEEKTFEKYLPKRAKLKEAYEKSRENLNIAEMYSDGEMTLDDATDLVEDLNTSDDEEDFIVDDIDTENTLHPQSTKRFVRTLKCPPTYLYLIMRIILDPQYPGGYRVESPFDLNGIDNSYYQRQIQWLVSNPNVFIGDEKLDSFLNREICKIAPNYREEIKDFSVFLLEKMPLLNIHKDKLQWVYNDMKDIYSLMQRQNSLIAKENIVSNIARKIVENLFNKFFQNIPRDTLERIAGDALSDLNYLGTESFKNQIITGTSLCGNNISWSNKYVSATIDRLNYSKGNSIVEKFINVVIVNYYLGTPQTRAFLIGGSIQHIYDLTEQLNDIRKKVSHDTRYRFESSDYDFYMRHVFELINSILTAFNSTWVTY